MTKMTKNLSLVLAVVFSAFTFASSASAQIILLDGARINKEAEAYKDIMSKTALLRTEINKLNQYVNRENPGYMAEAKAIEDKKSLIGQEKYTEEMTALQNKIQQVSRALIIRQNQLDEVLQEANRQITRASKPITKDLLTKHKALILMYKADVIQSATGIDKTTEFIELLNNALPAVKINVPSLAPAAAPPAAAQPAAQKK